MILKYSKDKHTIEARLAGRKRLYDRSLIADIEAKFRDVERRGDGAVRALTQEYDGVELGSLELPASAIRTHIEKIENSKSESLNVDLLRHIDLAIGRVQRFNERIKPQAQWLTEIEDGITVGEKHTALDSVGLWVPCRKGPLLSTAIMLVTAAKVAGVRHIALGLPPSASKSGVLGSADLATLVAGYRAGADSFFVGNGVGILAGWTLGTETLPKVSGIFGPGPNAIAASMAIAFSHGVKTVLGIGPTDSAILWDGVGDPQTIAYDLLNEAEHGRDSTSVLITTSNEAAVEVQKHIQNILQAPAHALTNSSSQSGYAQQIREHKNILKHAFSPAGTSCIIVVDTLDEGIEFINDFAPEHCIVNVADVDATASIASIENCGEILLGAHTPFSAANYCIGITAVLPTSGFARNTSGITCRDFLKTTSIGKLSQSSLRSMNSTIQAFSAKESLPFHGFAAQKRFGEGGSY